MPNLPYNPSSLEQITSNNFKSPLDITSPDQEINLNVTFPTVSLIKSNSVI